MSIIQVVLPLPINKTFDYLLPENTTILTGIRVSVPFKKGTLIGIVVAYDEKNQKSADKLKSIIDILDDKPLFSPTMWQLLHWGANYYHSPLGVVLFHAIPALLRKGNPSLYPSQIHWSITNLGNSIPLKQLKNSPKRQQLLAMLKNKSQTYKQCIEQGINNKILKILENKGWIIQKLAITKSQNWLKDFSIKEKRLQLNEEQFTAIKTICTVSSSYFKAYLLRGVTGSGKTEVYLNIIENYLSNGQQALVLVPEIGLTPQIIHRFKKRFNAPIDVVHSGINHKERLSTWMRARNGDNAIVVGTRSAIFTPFCRLGIIIIDEEHDNSYKQQEGWRYHARDLAVLRARLENIPIILGSATPSLQTLHNANIGKYHHLALTKRAGKSQLPQKSLFDLKNCEQKSGVANPLLHKIEKCLANDEQVMLFLNRRGYAPILLCHECGWMAECSRCNKYYTLHQQHLCCHHCEGQRPIPQQCGKCNSINLLTIGVGTEQLEQMLLINFPGIPVTRIDRDTTRGKGKLKQQLTEIEYPGPRILIGTQMLAKGHHFPYVTLVILLNIDNALFSEDFNASERLAQLYTQVAGRAGRGSKLGEVILQTYHPKHPLLQTLLHKEYYVFATKTLEERFHTALPPYTHHILVRAKDHNNQLASLFLLQLRKFIEKNYLVTDLKLLGPTPSLQPKIAGYFRWQLLIQHPSRKRLYQIIHTIIPHINHFPGYNKIKLSWDVDPIEG